jgi:AcrR family transcriptional regulator
MAKPRSPGSGRGRPRDEAKDREILVATRQLFSQVGYGALTIEGVAARAEVARTTIYRRWPTKLDLVMAVLDLVFENAAEPSSGNLRDDLIALELENLEVFDSPGFRIAGPVLISDLASYPDFAAAYRSHMIEGRREAFLRVLRRGVEQGDLRPATDLGLAMDQLTGPLLYRALWRGLPLPRQMAEEIVDTILARYGAPKKKGR